mmetsp:Transcript_17302/g.40160  ORF Transcript_17302/g.40160 Transcript_17302/m.40160 type:complete len:100 (+) Transcript_17302:302-601(+)
MVHGHTSTNGLLSDVGWGLAFKQKRIDAARQAIPLSSLRNHLDRHPISALTYSRLGSSDPTMASPHPDRMHHRLDCGDRFRIGLDVFLNKLRKQSKLSF